MAITIKESDRLFKKFFPLSFFNIKVFVKLKVWIKRMKLWKKFKHTFEKKFNRFLSFYDGWPLLIIKDSVLKETHIVS